VTLPGFASVSVTSSCGGCRCIGATDRIGDLSPPRLQLRPVLKRLILRTGFPCLQFEITVGY